MLVEGDNPLSAPKNVRMLVFCSRVVQETILIASSAAVLGPT